MDGDGPKTNVFCLHWLNHILLTYFAWCFGNGPSLILVGRCPEAPFETLEVLVAGLHGGVECAGAKDGSRSRQSLQGLEACHQGRLMAVGIRQCWRQVPAWSEAHKQKPLWAAAISSSLPSRLAPFQSNQTFETTAQPYLASSPLSAQAIHRHHASLSVPCPPSNPAPRLQFPNVSPTPGPTFCDLNSRFPPPLRLRFAYLPFHTQVGLHEALPPPSCPGPEALHTNFQLQYY